jgi:PhnB protein
MKLHNYLLFNGNCEEAFKFYERVLGGKIEALLKHTGTPAEASVPPEWRDKILHASLVIGNERLLASDAPPGHFAKPQGFSVSVTINGVSEGERLFKDLSENGEVTMPFSKTFWSPGFGMCVDRFGIPWMVNTEQAS